MANDYIEKLKRLSPAVQQKLSDEGFLARLDALDERYGVKAVLILLGLLSQEIDYAGLADKLKTEYNLNDFLADEIKGKFGDLIKELGEATISPESAPVEIPQPAKNTSPRPSQPITFSLDDEDEVKKYIGMGNEPKADYSVRAQDILSRFGYRSQDPVMMKRLENIIIAKLRDVRDDLETKDGLMKSAKIGGMEFSEADADRLLGLINHQPSAVAVADSAYGAVDLSAEEKPAIGRQTGGFNQPVIEMEDGLPVVRMPAKYPPPEISVAESRGEETEKLPQTFDNVKIKPTEAELLPPATPLPFIAEKNIPDSVLNAKTASRPNLDDVKLEKKLQGPIEELEMMTIIDFRRLAPDPQAAVGKVKEKIDLLGHEGFNEKILGINAWNKSEVSRFYRLLGQQSLSDGKNIEGIIKERLLAGKPTLSLEEFHAVMELNRALRF